MTGFDDIIKSTKWNQNIYNSLGLSSQISEILKFQDQFKTNYIENNTITQLAKNFQQQEKTITNLSGISMLTELAKSMRQQHIGLSPTLSSINAITKSLQFTIPQTTLESIASINNQHNQLFFNLRSLTEMFSKNQSAFSQINNWQFTVSSISGQLAAIAATQGKWDLIDDYEEITEEAISLNQRIFDENGVTNEGLNELKEFLKRIEIKVDKIDSDANTLFWKLLTLLSFILALMGEGRNWQPKPEYATKQEVKTLISNQFSIYEEKLKEDKEYRITNRVCQVMSKPKFKSLTIEKLPVDFEVTVLQIHHKWIYVSYFSPKENLPQTGWIMKKYLNRPKK